MLLDRTQEFSVMVDFAGVDGAGKGSNVNLLHAWMDTRLLTTNAYERTTDNNRQRPRFWRYWRDLPRRGRMALTLSGRYSHPFLDRVHGRIRAIGPVANFIISCQAHRCVFARPMA